MKSFSTCGNYKWMKSKDNKTSRGASKATNSSAKLVKKIIVG